MTSRNVKIRAALKTLEGERIRWLLGKKETLTTGENVFGETITDARYSFILQKAAAVELERNMLLLQMEQQPRTVHELHDATGISKPEIVQHIIALKRWRMIEQVGTTGQSPQYKAVPRSQPSNEEVS
ncbi:MAG: ArsR family transcriptional regulator [Methanobacteriota archaeon]|nr:MAG: ArsR family transcriptional regulator [Euryarchaeota archaeon]